ncbi:MAG: GNAT family N-acetyltransferase [Spirulinaceae cyanobacterium RM2_2_10]|nr:GNAT family N-acetyltransferase [Spirulinaceae cyanobacterium RM2_2_10]
MDVVEFRTSHHAELSKFWKLYGWTPPSEEMLPKKGFVAFFAGQVVGAAFVYLSCNGMAFLDWVIVDPIKSPILRGKAVYKTVLACRTYAKEQGKKVLYTVTANESLLRTYKKMGFENMEKNATTMAMSLDGYKTDFLR